VPNYTMDFWTGLRTATGANSRRIILCEGFGIKATDTGMESKSPEGFYYCCASINNTDDVVSLDLLSESSDNTVRSYWLPWKDNRTTSAARAVFEDDPDCNYFMTPRLEGCRFVLTADKVLHVAANALNAIEGAAGSATRDKAERAVIGDARSRRLSISSTNINDEWSGYPYEKQAFVFGVKLEDAWQYKALIINRSISRVRFFLT
jgi:hypothetical protein